MPRCSGQDLWVSTHTIRLVLAPPKTDRLFLLYISATAIDDSWRKSNAIYYIIQSSVDYQKLPPIYKHCLALVWATRKLRHYLLSQSIIKLLPITWPIFPSQEEKASRWKLLSIMEYEEARSSLTERKGAQRSLECNERDGGGEFCLIYISLSEVNSFNLD